MYGSVVAMAVREAARLQDKKRNKWVETREEDGKSVEYLMVYDELGYPKPRQRVIRFNEEELHEWQTALDERFPVYASRWKSFVDMLKLSLPWISLPRNNKFRRRRQQVLSDSGYDGVPENHVDTMNPYTTYVILLKGEEPTP